MLHSKSRITATRYSTNQFYILNYVHENKKSFRTGDPENSGFRRMQLATISNEYRRQTYTRTHLRKYDNPILRCSKNLGLNFDITLFGGKGGMAASELGKVCKSLSRRSSNSEYRFRMRIDPPCNNQSQSLCS